MIAVAAGGLLAVPPVAGAAPATRVETPIKSISHDAHKVTASYVRLKAPLPEEAGPRPPQCDWIGYLRFRAATGPREARNADAVFVAMPGIFAGASSLEIFARNVVRTAHEKGHRHVEVWTLDRRSNCLEDHYGVQAAAKKRNYRLALNYYFHGKPINGRKFAGYKSNQEAAFLKEVGLEQTVRDEYTVITRGMPANLRRKKVFCGGHSLGGPLTTAFANWDFDGNPETTADAGYNQCAGFFALDTRLDLGEEDEGGGNSSVGIAQVLAEGSGASPYVNAPPFTPETIQAVPPTALAATQAPREESDVNKMLPDNANFQASFRTLFSRDAANAATQKPSVRDFRVTNETALAAIFDDNSSPISILRTSLGTYKGGAVAQKEWPAPYNEVLVEGLIDGRRLMIPIEPKGPLYGWWTYTKFGKPGTPRQLDEAGNPFTWGASEVTAMRQYARAYWEAPLDFSEQYFPLRLLEDEGAASGGDRSGDLENLRHDGIPKRPQYYADAQFGIEEGASPPPKGPGPSDWLRLPGYDHIDVATAALHQKGGKRDQVSARLWKFARAVVGK